MLHPQVSHSQVSDFSQTKSMNHPNCGSCVRFDCHMTTQTKVVQNRLQPHSFGCRPHHRCQFGFSAARGQNCHSFGPSFHELATPHCNTSHRGLPRGVASSKVCVTEHFDIAVQWGPGVSASHPRVFDCVSCNSLEGNEVLCTWRRHFPHQLFHRVQEVWSVYSKKIESGRYTLEQLQFFSNEKIILLTDLFGRIVPFCCFAHLADFTGFWSTHIVGSRSPHTFGTGQPQCFQCAGNMLLVRFVLNSPLSQCQRSAQDGCCPRL